MSISFSEAGAISEPLASELHAWWVAAARAVQARRSGGDPALGQLNADAEGAFLTEIATPDSEGQALLVRAAERFGLSARGYHRVLRVGRTIADLAGEERVRKPHVAEALGYRIGVPGLC